MLGAARGLWVYLQVFGAQGPWIWVRTLISRPFLVTISVSGQKSQSFWLRAGTSDVEVYKKVFIDEEYRLPFDANPSTIFDLGANVGFASAYYALAFPSASILAVEPSDENFELMQRNLKSFAQVKIIKGAVWSEDGELNLIDPGIGPWGLQVAPTSQGQKSPVVQSFTIRSLMSQQGISRLDLLKVDIEGAEKEVFEHCGEWIDNVSAIVIELHDRYKVGCSRSFYAAVQGIRNERWIGENVFVWR